MTMTSQAGAQPDAQAERPGVITMQGNPMTLLGRELKVGDRVPDFHVQAADTLQSAGWDDLSAGGTRAVLLILIPSIDTNVCALETSKFNRQVAHLPADKIKVVSVSADTPFAQSRWAKQEGVNNIQMLSDHKDRSFGPAFGAQIKELGLLSRSIYLIDKGGIVRYAELVPEIASEPDYDAVLAAAREVIAA